MTATLNSGYPFNSTSPFVGTPSFTYSRLTVTQSSDPNATVGENIDFYGFGRVTGLQYAEFGLWVLNSSVLNSGSQYIGTYGGALSPTPAGGVPTTGTAAYNGLAVGSIQNSPSESASRVAGYSGIVGLNADFGTGAVTGSITNIEAYILNVLKGSVNDIGISANIAGTTLAGTTSVTGAIGSGYDISGAAGQVVGQFAGATGTELAGSFYLSGGANANSVIGSFGAGQMILPPTPAPAPTTNFYSEEVTISGTSPNFALGDIKSGQFFSYTGALPNGITGSPATSNFTVATVGGSVSGTAALGNGLQTFYGFGDTTSAQLNTSTSTDATIPAATGYGALFLFDETFSLDYTTFGSWALEPSNSGTAQQYIGVVAGAKPGASVTPVASMPTTGTATYSGGAFGIANQPGGYTVPSGSSASAGNTAVWSGALNLTATWAGNTLNGSITGINAYTYTGVPTQIGTINDISLSSTISGSAATGTASAAAAAGTAFNIAGSSGPLQAAFYGPAANEVAGTFHMTGGTNNVTVIGSFGGRQGVLMGSDSRLKTDVLPAGLLPSGLRLYQWRYLGGAHRFTGVMAQDVAADPRFAGAVLTDADGLMRVDYAAIGYIPADPALMQQEGEAAIRIYRTTLH